jgi:hypothetical protein
VRFLPGAQDLVAAYPRPRPRHGHVWNAAARSLGPICARGTLGANLLGGGEGRARWAVVRFFPGAQGPAPAYPRPRPPPHPHLIYQLLTLRSRSMGLTDRREWVLHIPLTIIRWAFLYLRICDAAFDAASFFSPCLGCPVRCADNPPRQPPPPPSNVKECGLICLPSLWLTQNLPPHADPFILRPAGDLWVTGCFGCY